MGNPYKLTESTASAPPLWPRNPPTLIIMLLTSGQGFNEIVDLLAPVANIDMKGKGGWTSLYSAAFHNKVSP